MDGISTLIHASLQSAKALGIDITTLELKPWLLFQSEAEPWAKGNLNIQFIDYNRVKVLVFDRDKSSKKITIEPVVPKGYARLVKGSPLYMFYMGGHRFILSSTVARASSFIREAFTTEPQRRHIYV
ncbi:MAG: hypothetical protein DRO40_13650 [Thermoprotei archaeon]|nr:MAG: hypothetical protein DRO40_13650 [Thermoprotei archaeon]